MILDNFKEYLANVLRFVCLSVFILIHSEIRLKLMDVSKECIISIFGVEGEAKHEKDGSSRGSMFLRKVHKFVLYYRALNPIRYTTDDRTTQFSNI
jgi:hypothetical protein